jgi:hypothetical protein
MILSYYLFLASLASRFSLGHRKVNLASIIAFTRTAQIQRGGGGGLSAFLLIKRIYALALKLSPSRRPEIHIPHHEVLSFLNLLSFSFVSPYTEAKPRCLYYFLMYITLFLDC